MAKVSWTSTSPKRSKKLTRADLKRYFNPVVQKHRNVAFNHYRTIVSKWSVGSRPKFKRVTGMKALPGEGLSIFSSVGINDNHTPLWWLDQGTRIRYRLMSPNWVSKTMPNHGIAPQRGGRGYAAGWGVAPGIQPRYFRRGIIDDVEPRFVYDAQKAFEQMCKDMWP